MFTKQRETEVAVHPAVLLIAALLIGFLVSMLLGV